MNLFKIKKNGKKSNLVFQILKLLCIPIIIVSIFVITENYYSFKAKFMYFTLLIICHGNTSFCDFVFENIYKKAFDKSPACGRETKEAILQYTSLRFTQSPIL